MFGKEMVNNLIYIDAQTILFRTPSCPLLEGDEDVTVLINIQENDVLSEQIEFVYLTCMQFQ